MASFQIIDLETPIEDLSSDVAGNITGGSALTDLIAFSNNLREETFALVRKALDLCVENPECQVADLILYKKIEEKVEASS